MSFFLLKVLAIVTMLIDHIGAYLFPECNILRWIGRIAFPIFAFCIANGYKYTHNKFKYAARILGCGIISIIPYAMVHNKLYNESYNVPYTSNIFFTLLLGLIAIHFYEQAKVKRQRAKYLLNIAYAIGVLLCFSLGNTLQVEYGLWAVVLIFMYNIVIDSKLGIAMNTILGNFIMSTSYDHQFTIPGMSQMGMPDFSMQDVSGILDVNHYVNNFRKAPDLEAMNCQWFGAVCAIPLCLYNGKKGYSAKWVQYGFYLFYPLHLLIISFFM